ncbi:hypothetical protein ALC56_11810 [Trachymyrmex septentrionalis]|uniref:Uncharacterized protein n=1 Tax=Trachymyrmex septentrionalis TaxID=34720 RepID=A0A151JTR8_9HYME|nr:hypothetical protein ALC56_11810 [Trachymyrmex septentrionalis]
MFNYNTNVHEATKHTPYELVFGKIVRILSNELLGPEDKLANYNDYLINLVTQLHVMQKNARENVVEAKIKSKKHYDKKINPQQNGKYLYIQETSRETCERMYTLGYFRMGHVYITGLKSNQTVSQPATLAGHVDNDGTCHGYSDSYGTWTDVIVLATLTFTLVDYEATVRLNTNKVILRSGVACEFATTHCVITMEIATLNTKYLTRSPLKVKVIRMDSPTLFWVQLDNSKEDFKDLMEDLARRITR